jgi:hypothetical protein
VLQDGVGSEHGDRLDQERGGAEAIHPLAGTTPAERVDGPAFAERRQERDQNDDPKQAVAPVEDSWIARLQGKQQQKRDDADEPGPVAKQEGDCEQPRNDEQ